MDEHTIYRVHLYILVASYVTHHFDMGIHGHISVAAVAASRCIIWCWHCCSVQAGNEFDEAPVGRYDMDPLAPC